MAQTNPVQRNINTKFKKLFIKQVCKLMCLLVNIRSQEINWNLNRVSIPEPPDLYPGALAIELSWFNCKYLP